MRDRDTRELRRRFEETGYIFECGYDPIEVSGGLYWLKRKWGSLHTQEGALEDIERSWSRTGRTTA